MQPQDQTLAQLFDGKLVYIVPTYQRLYVWNRDDQWEPLWSDVRDIAEELIENAAGTELDDTDHDAVEPHFMGAVVFKISGTTPDLAMKYRVIDGQQRLTTLQILMAAAASALDVAGLTEPANNLRNFTVNISASQPLKIQYQRHSSGHDYERFPDVMGAARDRDGNPSIGGPMADCYRYFKSEIHEWLRLHGDRINVAGTALVRTLALKLRVVAIYLDPHEKEHAIFESLNARGEPLTEWDKIKNYLLYKADVDRSLSQETFFEQYLDAFDDPWWRQLIGRGVQRPRVDVFVDYWLEAQTGQPPATSSWPIPTGSPTPEHFCETAPASSSTTSMRSSVARASRFSRHPSRRRSRTRSPNAGSALCDASSSTEPSSGTSASSSVS